MLAEPRDPVPTVFFLQPLALPSSMVVGAPVRGQGRGRASIATTVAAGLGGMLTLGGERAELASHTTVRCPLAFAVAPRGSSVTYMGRRLEGSSALAQAAALRASSTASPAPARLRFGPSEAQLRRVLVPPHVCEPSVPVADLGFKLLRLWPWRAPPHLRSSRARTGGVGGVGKEAGTAWEGGDTDLPRLVKDAKARPWLLRAGWRGKPYGESVGFYFLGFFQNFTESGLFRESLGDARTKNPLQGWLEQYFSGVLLLPFANGNELFCQGGSYFLKIHF